MVRVVSIIQEVSQILDEMEEHELLEDILMPEDSLLIMLPRVSSLILIILLVPSSHLQETVPMEQ